MSCGLVCNSRGRGSVYRHMAMVDKNVALVDSVPLEVGTEVEGLKDTGP